MVQTSLTQCNMFLRKLCSTNFKMENTAFKTESLPCVNIQPLVTRPYFIIIIIIS